MLRARWLPLLLAFLVLPGCNGPAESAARAPSSELEDELWPAAPPEFDGAMWEEFDYGYRNRSQLRVRLDIVEPDEPELHEPAARLYPNFRAASDAVGGELLVSIDMADSYNKYTGDRLIAAVERELHDGSAPYPGGKQGWLGELLAAVLTRPQTPARDLAAAGVCAALKLGGATPSAPAEVIAEADAMIARFDNFPVRSRPIGFYEGDPELEAIFRRDRFLQERWGHVSSEVTAVITVSMDAEIELAAAVELAEALAANPHVLDGYKLLLAVNQRLTNPGAAHSLLDLLAQRQHSGNLEALSNALGDAANGKDGVAILPYSQARENSVIARLVLSGTPFDQLDMMEDFAAAIRSGTLDLKPTPESGYYDHQIYQLETLLVPERGGEADKLVLSGTYLARLKQAFKALVTQRREMQVKNAELFASDSVAPAPSASETLHLEPAPTVYLRTARGYRFLAHYLSELLGEPALARITLADGGSVRDELDQAAALFYGLYLLSCGDLGMWPKLEPGELDPLAGVAAPIEPELTNFYSFAHQPGISAAEGELRAALADKAGWWLDGIEYKACADYDARVIVPVARFGPEVKYWAVPGVRLQRLAVEARGVRVAHGMGGVDRSLEEGLAKLDAAQPEDSFEPEMHWIAVYSFVETEGSPKPYTRAEFRELCDKLKDEEAIRRRIARDFVRR